MLLHCTLIRALQPYGGGQPCELTIRMHEETVGADIEAEIARRFGTTQLFVGGVPLAALGKLSGVLVQGVVFVDSSATSRRDNHARRRPDPDQPILSLVIHAGTDAGMVFPLKRGSYRIGRKSSDITIADPGISREHARLEVTDTSVTITDLGSANGTLVDGERRREAIITTASWIRCGDSFMRISPGVPETSRQHLEEAGASVSEAITVPAAQQQGNRLMLLITAGAPLLIGVGLAVITGMWMFLAFSAMSAIAVLVPVFAGRRQRREFRETLDTAVQQDQDRRRRAAPSIAELMTAGPAQVAEERTWHPGKCEGTWLRAGQGEQTANIRLEPSGTTEQIPRAGLLPLTLDPRTEQTTVRGPLPLRSAFMRNILLQLTHVPRAACTKVIVHGASGELPLSARFFPGVELSADPDRTRDLLDSGFGTNGCHGVLLLAERASKSVGLTEYAAARGWQIFRFLPSGSAAAATDIALKEHRSVFTTAGRDCPLIPDLVAEVVFDRAARARNTSLMPSLAAEGFPTSCSLDQVLSLAPDAVSARWDDGRCGPGLRVPLGMSSEGTRFLDLEADGPHVLVAGTTGSGKSELLRSITAGLALSYPPDRVNFLLVDFKGGSGLSPLMDLPHSVGMLTDLAPDELDRFLVSLRAEVRRREHQLAAAGAADLASYRQTRQSADSPIPQLVLVIDEFRMLVEDAPSALGELMRIATIGRSLGLHLIMATQRPQGAITADIRANVTSSIALRVQSEMESFDVINSNEAAGIDLSTPGRAFLSRAAEAPEEFQTASLGQSSPSAAGPVSVHLAQDVISLQNIPLSISLAGQGTAPAAATAPFVKLLAKLWEGRVGKMPRRPVAANLPSELAYQESWKAGPPDVNATDPQKVAGDEAPAPQTDVVSASLGILDKPHEQRLAAFEWSPRAHGHLAFVGNAALGGQGPALDLVIQQLLREAAESHLYLLDGLGILNGFSAGGRIGAKASVHELRRGVRVLERIHEEMANRLSRPADRRGTPLVLVIAGWGAWVSALRSGPLMWAEDLVQDIVRDGSHARITVIISGERELVTSRFFAAVPNRIYCPSGSTEESRLAWPSMPRTADIAGRAVAFGPAALGGPAVCQLYTSGSSSLPAGNQKVSVAPFRVEPLPSALGKEFLSRIACVSQSRPGDGKLARTEPMARGRELVLGLGGDELELAGVSFPAGSVLAVLGRPGSGRSNFLGSLPVLNPDRRWLAPGPQDDPAAYWSSVHASVADPSVTNDLSVAMGICLVDDADRLPAITNQHILDLNARGLSVVVTAGYSSSLMQRVPVAMAARNNGAGLLVAPRTLADGEVFGTRFDVEPAPPAGRSVLITQGRAFPLQLPFLPDPAGDAGTEDQAA